MTGGVLMNRGSRWLVLLSLLVVCVVGQLSAQDRLPNSPVQADLETKSKPLPNREVAPDTLIVKVDLPDAFVGMGCNVVADSFHVLAPVFEHLRLVKAGISEDTVRIVHIGDSHIRGHIFPQTTGERLATAFGLISYTDMGVNGATSLTFTHPDRIADIAALNPELLILSFGTNESHNRNYDANVHYQQMKELLVLLRDSLPDVPVLLTTPSGSYESFRKRRRRTYVVNPRTASAAKVICNFALDHQLAVWDMYSAVGGQRRACRNWQEAGLLRPDHVHYMPEGYILQGELLYEAIIKTYNYYVSH